MNVIAGRYKPDCGQLVPCVVAGTPPGLPYGQRRDRSTLQPSRRRGGGEGGLPGSWRAAHQDDRGLCTAQVIETLLQPGVRHLCRAVITLPYTNARHLGPHQRSVGHVMIGQGGGMIVLREIRPSVDELAGKIASPSRSRSMARKAASARTSPIAEPVVELEAVEDARPVVEAEDVVGTRSPWPSRARRRAMRRSNSGRGRRGSGGPDVPHRRPGRHRARHPRTVGAGAGSHPSSGAPHRRSQPPGVAADSSAPSWNRAQLLGDVSKSPARPAPTRRASRGAAPPASGAWRRGGRTASPSGPTRSATPR